MNRRMDGTPHRIVIVGGGAGGLELATRLGHRFGRDDTADVTLIDSKRPRIWKPKLHEIAAGSMDIGDHEVAYLAQAHWYGFRFRMRMVNACVRAHARRTPLRPEQLHVAIIGAGATGVELAAELHHTTREVVAYGLDRIDADKDIRHALIEAAPRVLPALPERLSASTERLLRKLGVEVHTDARVAEVRADGVRLADGRILPAELVVWAAGVKGAEFLTRLDGLETNRINQLVVRQTLQTTADDHIFPMGDCAACPWPEKNGFVPPRAQAAHQQASHL